MRKLRTWILIADGGRARVLTRRDTGDGLAVVPGHAFEANLSKSSEMGTERPGRGHESHGNARHAIEAKTDMHDAAERAFLGSLVTELGKALEANKFDRLAVVAAPRALGMLRPALTDKLRGVLVAEIGKDLTKTPDHEIPSHLPPEVLR